MTKSGPLDEIRWSVCIIIIIIIIIILLMSFLHQLLVVAFHWSLNDTKYPQVSRTLLRILADLNVVVLMVSGLLFLQPLFRSFEDCSKHTNYNWYFSNLHVPEGFFFFFFFFFFGKVQAFVNLFVFFYFYSASPPPTIKSTKWQIHFYLLRSLSDKYPWEMYEPPYSPDYE